MRTLTFCSNILPGTGFDAHMAELEKTIPSIKKQNPWLATLGLRMSAEMVSELLADENKRSRLVTFLDDNELLISTVNAFPMHDFQKPGLKDQVYQPDWSHTERFGYTRGCAKLLAELPTTPQVSMSTVPLGYKPHHRKSVGKPSQTSDLADFVRPMLNMVSELKELSLASNKQICLALESEPDCLLETTDEVLTFFRMLNDADHPSSRQERQDYLGLCFDTCHFAVNFESTSKAIQAFHKEGVSLFKIQLSNALKWGPGLSHEDLSLLYDDTYLHQIRSRDKLGAIRFYSDAPTTSEVLTLGEQEWRCHFHTPIFQKNYQKFESTQSEIHSAITAACELDDHLKLCFEIETYTWCVLPEDMKPASIADCVNEELKWAKSKIKTLN